MDSLKALIGLSLEMVCINSNQIYFHFGVKSYLVIESKYRVIFSDETLDFLHSIPEISKEVLRLLNRKILSYSADDNGTLRIGFDGGFMIEVYGDSRGYESYKVVINSEEILAV